MKLAIELTEKEIRGLVYAELQRMMGDLPITENDILIEVKSKQNYKSEWESAAFRARVEVDKR